MSRKITTLKILGAIAAGLLLFICILSATGIHLMVYMPGDIIYASPEHMGKWDAISIARRSNDWELCGQISYEVPDPFYGDGRKMLHGMYVGQADTKFGEVVFLTEDEAIKVLNKAGE